jgi:hypothetical protein
MAELPARHAEAEARRLENEAWREKVRTKDEAWREKVRTEELAWREKVRTEELAWREKVRTEDRAERDANHAQSLQCLARGLAFLAVTQNAKPRTPTEELARRAQDFARWIGDVGGTTHQGT